LLVSPDLEPKLRIIPVQLELIGSLLQGPLDQRFGNLDRLGFLIDLGTFFSEMIAGRFSRHLDAYLEQDLH
jgi:hypothetical protein